MCSWPAPALRLWRSLMAAGQFRCAAVPCLLCNLQCCSHGDLAALQICRCTVHVDAGEELALQGSGFVFPVICPAADQNVRDKVAFPVVWQAVVQCVATIPASPTVTPPGDYLLTLLDSSVPSEAVWISIG